ncbi:MAG: hypothetical protein OHK93_002857 [Ramalina farinacea]|uniref:Uncharacterized protein n=1 Tax=Ramalina farinacea TaxID=258253 RepID=A0AA43QVH3_9LECA|nr:hypothetical protein [Ramalina farinacea]
MSQSLLGREPEQREEPEILPLNADLNAQTDAKSTLASLTSSVVVFPAHFLLKFGTSKLLVDSIFTHQHRQAHHPQTLSKDES